MNYELRDTDWQGSPKTKSTDETKVEVFVNVKTGIVGETHGFTKEDTISMEFDKSMTGDQMEADTIVQAQAYITANYPNT